MRLVAQSNYIHVYAPSKKKEIFQMSAKESTTVTISVQHGYLQYKYSNKFFANDGQADVRLVV